MSVFVTHWARLALAERARSYPGIMTSIARDACHIGREMVASASKGGRYIRREKGGPGDTGETQYYVTVREGRAVLDVHWRCPGPNGTVSIMGGTVRIPGIPDSIRVSLAGKVPFDIREVVEGGPFDVLDGRTVIEVMRGPGGRTVLSLAPCPDRPDTVLAYPGTVHEQTETNASRQGTPEGRQ